MSKENKSAELSKMWMEVTLLRAEGKNVNGLIGILEERLFSEADQRIDKHFEQKREHIIFEAKKGGEK